MTVGATVSNCGRKVLAMNTTEPPATPRLVTERRKTPRVQVLGQLYGQAISLEVPISVRNVGLGGFSTESLVPFPLGARHEFRFAVAGRVAIQIKAVVVHRRPAYSADGLTSFITGFEFIHDAVHDTAADIRTLLAAASDAELKLEGVLA